MEKKTLLEISLYWVEIIYTLNQIILKIFKEYDNAF